MACCREVDMCYRRLAMALDREATECKYRFIQNDTYFGDSDHFGAHVQHPGVICHYAEKPCQHYGQCKVRRAKLGDAML